MLTAAKEVGVKRVVVTSSISAIIPSPNWPSDVVKREDCWTDVEYCKQKEVCSPFLFALFFVVFLGYVCGNEGAVVSKKLMILF